MIISEITCLWLQPQKLHFRNMCKTNGKVGFAKVAQIYSTFAMRDPSGKQGFYVVLMSVRIYKTINASPVAFGDGLGVASLSAQQQIVAQLYLKWW